MTKGSALNHYKSLQIYFFCVNVKQKNDFLKDVESTVADNSHEMSSLIFSERIQ